MIYTCREFMSCSPSENLDLLVIRTYPHSLFNGERMGLALGNRCEITTGIRAAFSYLRVFGILGI